MVSQKVVIPAKAGIHGISNYLSRVCHSSLSGIFAETNRLRTSRSDRSRRYFRYNDEQTLSQTFCAVVSIPYIKIPCGLAAGRIQ